MSELDDAYAEVGDLPLMLSWSIATREPLDQWEALVAEDVWRAITYGARPMDPVDSWRGARLHHWALTSACNLLQVVELVPDMPYLLPMVALEIQQTRDVLERRVMDLAAARQTIRTSEGAARSRTVVETRNPNRSPFGWSRWDARVGALLTMTVPATTIHHWLDEVEAFVLKTRPELEAFIPARPGSPWARSERHQWFPATPPKPNAYW